MYNVNDDDDNDNIVIVKDVNKEEEGSDEPDKHNYSKQGIL